MAKGIANGFPMGCMIAKRKYSDILTPGTHASTFGGTALACAAAETVADALLNGGVLENCRTQGEYLIKKLEPLKDKYPSCVQGVRGRGLMIGVVLAFPAGELLGILRSKGLIALSAGENVLRLVPPLIVTREQCDKALELIDAGLAELAAKTV